LGGPLPNSSAAFLKVRNSAQIGIWPDTQLFGSNLGPLAPENHTKTRYNTQNNLTKQ
jgi:hypothetical protein